MPHDVGHRGAWASLRWADVVGDLLVHEGLDEGDHDHAAVFRQPAQHVVRHVARVVRHRPGGGMGEDDRRLGHVECVVHASRRDVRDVDQHAQPVHLAHHFLPERGESSEFGELAAGVRPGEVGAVRESHVPDPERVKGPQGAERVLDRVASLHAEHRGDLAAVELVHHVRCGEREPQVLPVIGDDLERDVDLLQLHARAAAVLHDRGGDVDGPELGSDAAGPKAGEIGVPRRGTRDVVGADVAGRVRVPDRPGEVVVSVEQGDARQHAFRDLEMLCLRTRVRGRESENERGQHRHRRRPGENSQHSALAPVDRRSSQCSSQCSSRCGSQCSSHCRPTMDSRLADGAPPAVPGPGRRPGRRHGEKQVRTPFPHRYLPAC